MVWKLVTIASFQLLLISSSFAQGLYVGLGSGLEGANFTQDAHVKQQENQKVNFDVIDKQHQAGTGVFGSIFIGYGLNYCRFYLAGELNANASTVEFKSSNSEFIHKTFSNTYYKIRRSYGISLIPGLVLSNLSLLYARIGHVVGNFEISTTDLSLENQNKLLNGRRYGIGIKQSFYNRFSFIIDFSHIDYDQTRLFTFAQKSNTSKGTKIKPETAQIEIGIVYNFC